MRNVLRNRGGGFALTTHTHLAPRLRMVRVKVTVEQAMKTEKRSEV